MLHTCREVSTAHYASDSDTQTRPCLQLTPIVHCKTTGVLLHHSSLPSALPSAMPSCLTASVACCTASGGFASLSFNLNLSEMDCKHSASQNIKLQHKHSYQAKLAAKMASQHKGVACTCTLSNASTLIKQHQHVQIHRGLQHPTKFTAMHQRLLW